VLQDDDFTIDCNWSLWQVGAPTYPLRTSFRNSLFNSLIIL
jgi:hypothetical protein